MRRMSWDWARFHFLGRVRGSRCVDSGGGWRDRLRRCRDARRALFKWLVQGVREK